MSQMHEACTSIDDATDKIISLDAYFSECAAGGHGISTKETAWMQEAMLYILQNAATPFQGLRRVEQLIYATTSRYVLERAMHEATESMSTLFAPKAGRA